MTPTKKSARSNGHRRRIEPRIVDPKTHPRTYVGIRVAAEFLEVDPKTLAVWLDNGELEFQQLPRTRRIAVSELVAFTERTRVRRRHT